MLGNQAISLVGAEVTSAISNQRRTFTRDGFNPKTVKLENQNLS